MELFAKIVHGLRRLTISVISSVLDVGLSFEYASADSNPSSIFSKNEAADLFPNQAPIGTFLKQIILISIVISIFHKETTGVKFHRSSSHKATLCFLGSFIKRQTSGKSSDNESYNE